MSLIRYQFPQAPSRPSFARFSTLRDELDRIFDFTPPTRDRGPFAGWTPALDVYDEKDKLVVKVELPGLKKEDIKISLHEGVLNVSGERKNETEKKEGQTFRTERSFGQFQRSVTLPTAVDPTKVTAAYKDGVLTVELPKAEEAKPKQIEVSVS